MSEDASALPHETPLAARHEALGARMIDFAGWRMPVQYSSILEEHRAVRERAGLFDLSHMGELWVEGQEAASALDAALVSAPSRLAVGRAHYSMIVAPTAASSTTSSSIASPTTGSWSWQMRATPTSSRMPWPSGWPGPAPSSTTIRWRPASSRSRARAASTSFDR